jgi:hypothetical protein
LWFTADFMRAGLIPLTCQVDVPMLRQLRDDSILKILKTQSKNGMFGGDVAPSGSQKNTYWGRMIIVLALEAYVECTGPYAPSPDMQAKVEAALLRHHQAIYNQMTAESPPYWREGFGAARYVEILIGVQWLIDRGHDDSFLWNLMPLARNKTESLLHWETFFATGNPYTDNGGVDTRCWPNKTDPAEVNFMTHHGVNIMEAIKTGPAWWRYSGNAFDLNNAAAALQFIDKYAKSTDGTFTAPDCIVEVAHTPTSGVETCSVVEEMYSLRTAYEITGKVEMMDRLEWVAFNAMPATTMSDFSGNAYYHSINQVTMAGKDGFGLNACCTGNVHQGWPKFIMSGVQTMHNASTAIVVSGYSPHKATLKDGTTVAVAGQYPFADNVTITVTPPSARSSSGTAAPAATLMLRIPCWVDSARVLSATGTPESAPPCSHFSVPGFHAMLAAAAGAPVTVTLLFGHSIKVVDSTWKTGSSVEITRGPLLYTFPVPFHMKQVSLNATNCGNATATTTSFTVDYTKPYAVGLKDPATAFTFSGFQNVHPGVPFDSKFPAATIKGQGRMVNGWMKRGRLSGIPPHSPVPASDFNGTLIDVELVPLANSHLRLTALPVLADESP